MSSLSSLNIHLKNSEDLENTISILTNNIQDTIQISTTSHPIQESQNINTTPEIKVLILLKRRARNTW